MLWYNTLTFTLITMWWYQSIVSQIRDGIIGKSNVRILFHSILRVSNFSRACHPTTAFFRVSTPIIDYLRKHKFLAWIQAKTIYRHINSQTWVELADTEKILRRSIRPMSAKCLFVTFLFLLAKITKNSMSFQLKPKRLVCARNYLKLHEINSNKGQCSFPRATTLNDKKKN